MKFFVVASFALTYASSATARCTTCASYASASASASSDDTDTSFALAYASSATASASASSDNTCDNVSVAYPSNLPWVNYEGNSYIFSRQKYNSVCVDPQGQEYEYGAIEGYYGSATPCSTACVEGYSRAEQRGCSANQRPPLNNLVGFQYDCEAATCYCLYDRGTLGNQYEQCFDYMDTGYQGSGPVSTTEAQYGETCYTVEIQSQSGPPGPGSDYCNDAPDPGCYNTPDGHPSCCSQPGDNCPPNKPPCNVGPPTPGPPGPPLGSNYCTDAPDYGCYNTPDGHPSCCNSGNCPPNKPGCDMPTPLPPQTEAEGVFEASFLSNNNKSSTLTCLEMCVDDAVQSGKKKYSVNNKDKINKSASKCAEDCTTKRSVSKCANQCFKRLSKDVQKVVDSEVRRCERKCNNDDPDYQKCKNKCSSSKGVSKKVYRKIERKASDKSYRCLNSCVYSEENQKYLRSQI